MTEPIADMGMFEGFVFARAVGEIDFSNASDFADALTEAADGTAQGLIIDLSSVAYLDSAGVRALFDVVRKLEARRQVVGVIVGESSPIRTLIKVTNLHEAIPVCDSAVECAAALSVPDGSGA